MNGIMIIIKGILMNGNKNGDNALELLLLSSSQTPAGQLTLKNTHPWLANNVNAINSS